MPLFCNTEVLFLATKTRELKKRSLFVKKLVSQNAPRLQERTDLFFNEEGKRAADERKKRVLLAFASENKKGKERER